MDELLAPGEGAAVEVREAHGPFVVVCEHAANRIPQSLGTLGLPPAELVRHIAWDPGAAELSRGIAAALDGALVTQRFSRLVIDCNRDPEAADAIATRSEDTEIPGNVGISPEARERRIAGLWAPFHAALEHLLDRRRNARMPTALVTVHSFTPVYRGITRPWHVGILSTAERRLAEGMLAELRRDPALVVGDNQPYSSKDGVDYTIRRHGRDRGLPHVMIEVRNDLLRAARDITGWAERLTEGLRASAIGIGPAFANSGTNVGT